METSSRQTMAPNRTELRVALALLGLSGAAALGHQILWTRRLTDLIGASVESSARVLECFYLGMALGSALAARVLPRLRRPWRAVGYTELGVAFLCVPVLLLPQWTGWLWPALGPERLIGWQGPTIRLALTLLLIVPPASLMGMVLPLMTAAICKPGEGFASRGTWMYAAYTFGGALGLALVIGLALHLIGVEAAMLLMIGTNLFVGAACLGWGLVRSETVDQARQTPEPPPASDDVQLSKLSSLLALLSGAGVMALEVLGLHLLNLKLPLAFYTPAAVLLCVVFLLACSATAVPNALRHLGGAGRLLPLSLAAAGLLAAACPVIFMSLTAGQGGIIVHGSGVSRSLFRLAGVTCLALGPAVLLAGVLFPALVCRCDPRRSAGRGLGQLLAVNGVGGIIGAEAALGGLLPAAGVHVALGAVGAFYGLLSIGLLIAWRRTRVLELAFPLVLVAGTGVLLGTALRHLPIFLRTATFQIIDVRSGREGSLAVVERADLGRAMFLDNLYLLGSSKAAPDMERQAHLPLLLHPSPRRVGFIGLGTGITAAGALRHEAVESITIVELSALVADAAARHFSAYNQGICSHPKARVHVEDAGPYLAAARERFDVIIGDLFTPWRPGEARLCSLEQFEAAREALLPRGVFCQWLPMSQLTAEQFKTIAMTFRQAFGEVHVFRNHFKTDSVPTALVGLKTGGLDWEVVRRRCMAERQHGRLRDPVCRHPEGLALLYLGTYEPERPWDGGLNTLGNLRVELGAGRHLLTGSPDDYFHGDGDRWLTFLQRQVAGIEGHSGMPESLQRFPKAGLLITRWEIANEQDKPPSSARQQELMAEIPDAIRSDSAADWSCWAGRELF
jgi:spermidine synthase